MAGVARAIDGVPEAIDGVPEAIDGVPEVIDGVPEAIDGIAQAIDGVQWAIAGVAQAIDGVTKSIVGVAEHERASGCGLAVHPRRPLRGSAGHSPGRGITSTGWQGKIVKWGPVPLEPDSERLVAYLERRTPWDS
jgi:hypothetical protein